MTAAVTWSIMVLTQARRQEKFLRLLDVLLPQAEAAGDVEVTALRNYGGYSQDSLGQLRQALLDDARGRWVSFIDDDDLVGTDFVPTVLAAIAGEPLAEFVAFRMAVWEGGRPDKITLTGLQYGSWRDGSDRAYIRDITHLNPVLAGHARRAGFLQPARTELSQPSEDKGYVNRLRPLLSGCAQAVIPRVMYRYQHDQADSVQNGAPPVTAPGPPPVIASPAFRWHPASAGLQAA